MARTRLAKREASVKAVVQGIHLEALMREEALGRLPLLAAVSVGEALVRWAMAEQLAGRAVGHVNLAGITVNAAGGLSVTRSDEEPLAPELTVGEAPDTLCDIYWWGTTLYQLLTGQQPDDVQPARPSSLNPAVDGALDALILSSLAHDAAQRPYSWQAVHAELLGFFELIESPPSLEELTAHAQTLPGVPAMHAVPVAPPSEKAAARPVRYLGDDDTLDEDNFQFSSEFAAWRHHNPALHWAKATLSDMRGQVGAAVVGMVLLAWVLWPSAPKPRPEPSTVATQRTALPRAQTPTPMLIEASSKPAPYRITSKVPAEMHTRNVALKAAEN